ncbi:MAG: serine/threonine-protein kinase [Baekduia sp.]
MVSEPDAPTSGSAVVLDRYRLLSRLGGGGMGVVWRAEDLKLGRHVAVKRIACGDAESARRADRETIAAARLQHPAIVQLYESVAEDEQVWLISELVEGRTFDRALAEGLLSDRDAVEIGVAIAGALLHAHREGVVHRDVKPQNILVPDEPSTRGSAPAKLTDFGIARLAGDDAVTRTGDVVGTLAYMAPEQAEGLAAGPEADCYALALCLYEGLSGVNPVRGRGAAATARRVGQTLPELGRVRRDLPLDLCAAIDDAVWPDPGERLRLRDLHAALKGSLADLSDEPGTVAGAAIEPLAGAPDVVFTGISWQSRIAAALLVTPLAALGPWRTGSEIVPADAIWIAPLAAFVLTALLPRLGWLAAASASGVLLAAAGDSAALPLLLAAVPVPLLLGRAEPWSWSLPLVATALGVAGAAVAAPALGVRIASPLHRLAAGLLSAWWLLLGQIASGHGLVPGVPVPSGAGSGGMSDEAIAALVSSPALMFAALCAAGAVVAPWVAGTPNTKLAVAGALAWAAALAALAGMTAPHSALELAAGAVIGAALVVVLRPSRPRGHDVQLP